MHLLGLGNLSFQCFLVYLNSDFMLVYDLNIKFQRPQENRKHWHRELNSARARLFHWELDLLPKTDLFVVKPNNTFRFSLIPKQGFFSSSRQNRNHYRDKIGRQPLCSQALIDANMQFREAVIAGLCVWPHANLIPTTAATQHKVGNAWSEFLSLSKLFGEELIPTNNRKEKRKSAWKGWAGELGDGANPCYTFSSQWCSKSPALLRAGIMRQSCIFFLLPWSPEGIGKHCCCW